MSDGKKYLFVVGCPRSGTTALGTLFSNHDDIFMGVERYAHRVARGRFSLAPELYELERFKQFVKRDTFYNTLEFAPFHHRDIDERLPKAIYVGDKIPMLYESLDLLFDAFGPDTRVIFIFRNIFDVAASYEARARDENDTQWPSSRGAAKAIHDWSAAIAAYRRSENKSQVYPVIYEHFFNSRAGVAPVLPLLQFLGLQQTPKFLTTYRHLCARQDQLEAQRTRKLAGNDIMDITMTAPFGGFRAIVQKAEKQAEAFGPRPEPVTPEHAAPEAKAKLAKPNPM